MKGDTWETNDTRLNKTEPECISDDDTAATDTETETRQHTGKAGKHKVG